MGNLFELQGYVALVLGVVLFAMEVFALADCIRRRPDAFTAAGKLSKPAWLAITAVAAVLGFLVITNPLSIFGIAAVVGAAVYLADVRPALQKVIGTAKRNNSGPYGPW
ncbi:DUF2516 family protein [Flexivirga meconopsidis]|uniref:DUF2516 family protein n=1 Tax=Flexivirga meconopsidis TaxID=2977121 RepID=UPI0022404F57|nr:DUF2516 family protein [Flexivirga meconopsidis]